MVKEWYDEKKTKIHENGFDLMCVHNSWETREYFKNIFEVRVFIVAVNGILFTVLHPRNVILVAFLDRSSCVDLRPLHRCRYSAVFAGVFFRRAPRALRPVFGGHNTGNPVLSQDYSGNQAMALFPPICNVALTVSGFTGKVDFLSRIHQSGRTQLAYPGAWMNWQLILPLLHDLGRKEEDSRYRRL